jgi:hypothetical protein
MSQAVSEHTIPRVETEKNVDGSGEAVCVCHSAWEVIEGTRRIVFKHHIAIKYKEFTL